MRGDTVAVLVVLGIVVLAFMLIGVWFDSIDCWISGGAWFEGRCIR